MPLQIQIGLSVPHIFPLSTETKINENICNTNANGAADVEGVEHVCIGRGHSILLQVTQIEIAQGEKLITYVKVSLEACELYCRRKNSEFLAKIKKQIYLTYM